MIFEFVWRKSWNCPWNLFGEIKNSMTKQETETFKKGFGLILKLKGVLYWMEEHISKVDTKIRKKPLTKVTDIMSLSYGYAQAILNGDFWYRKVCTRSVPKQKNRRRRGDVSYTKLIFRRDERPHWTNTLNASPCRGTYRFVLHQCK